MMMRTNFDVSGYKQMNIKEFGSISGDSARLAPLRRKASPPTRPSLLAAALGAVCVLGVFALLGLLYTIG